MLRIGRRLTDRCIRHATGPVSLSGFRDVNKFTVHDLKLEVREMEHEKTKGKLKIPKFYLKLQTSTKVFFQDNNRLKIFFSKIFN